MITGLYAAIFALIQIILVCHVARLRYKHKTVMGNPDHVDELARARSVHGNLTENVPIFLILLFLLEFGSPNFLPYWALHAFGMVMVFSRLAHIYGILMSKYGFGIWRAVGVLSSFAAIGGAAIMNLTVYFLLVF